MFILPIFRCSPSKIKLGLKYTFRPITCPHPFHQYPGGMGMREVWPSGTQVSLVFLPNFSLRFSQPAFSAGPWLRDELPCHHPTTSPQQPFDSCGTCFYFLESLDVAGSVLQIWRWGGWWPCWLPCDLGCGRAVGRQQGSSYGGRSCARSRGTGHGQKSGACSSAVVRALKKGLESAHNGMVSDISNCTLQFSLQSLSGHLAILQLMHELPSVPPLHLRAVPYRIFYKTRWHSAN